MTFDTLAPEYERLFGTAKIPSHREKAVGDFCARLIRGYERYAKVVQDLGMEWWWVGIVHGLECNFNFSAHLHNGDPLTARTRRVPAGRPAKGKPPFTWEDSALDALRLKRLENIDKWDLARALYEWERYNGFGYRLYHPAVNSPYLWSMSNHYSQGKYASDGKFSPTLVSNQVGAAVALRWLVATGEVCPC